MTIVIYLIQLCLKSSDQLPFIWFHLTSPTSSMTSTSVEMIHALYEDGGEGSPSSPIKFKDQHYTQLKDSCRSQGRKFADETLPAKSLGKLEDITPEQLNEVEWLRPHVSQPVRSLKWSNHFREPNPQVRCFRTVGFFHLLEHWPFTSHGWRRLCLWIKDLRTTMLEYFTWR